MENRKRLFYCLLVAIALCVSLAIYNRCTGKPVVVDVKRDTVVVYDTVPDILPMPKDSILTKYVTRYLPIVRNDTIVKTDVITCHDSVLVEVPITSKHYGNEQYDAYVSGYEPNLDSIFVYQKTEYITETITKMKPPNKWELDGMAVVNYNVKTQKYTPYVGGELTYKPCRVHLGIQAGAAKADKIEPYIGLAIKYRVF